MHTDTSQPVTNNRFTRVLWFVIGVIMFIWIGYEDRTSTGPILVGGLIAGGLSFPLYARLLRVRRIAFQRRDLASVLTGLMAGMAAMPLAVLGMLVKISLHSHVPPDFTSAQVLAVLGKTPIWAGAGSLIGLAAALYHRMRP